ncbi:hypothetical protein CASFOL_022612 [Castilleja foliolosa]|uniref:Uncharacterized protein n=1 Tax=Castilleja foliolosa TaxID=1961234 RepID=A0ABD3CYU9_9LAMI
MEGKIKTELVFIRSPGRGHLSATLEMAKLLVDRDQCLSVTVLVIKPSYDPKGTAHSYSDHFFETNPRIRFVDIPPVEYSPTSSFHLPHFIESHKNHVRDDVAKIASAQGSESKLVGFVVNIYQCGRRVWHPDVRVSHVGRCNAWAFVSFPRPVGLSKSRFDGVRGFERRALDTILLIPCLSKAVAIDFDR